MNPSILLKIQVFRKKLSAIKLSYMITFVNGIREGSEV